MAGMFLAITSVTSSTVVLISIFIHWKGLTQRGNFNVTNRESTGNANLSERTERMTSDINQSCVTMTQFDTVRFLLIGLPF